jgi:hypothetical protein
VRVNEILVDCLTFRGRWLMHVHKVVWCLALLRRRLYVVVIFDLVLSGSELFSDGLQANQRIVEGVSEFEDRDILHSKFFNEVFARCFVVAVWIFRF